MQETIKPMSVDEAIALLISEGIPFAYRPTPDFVFIIIGDGENEARLSFTAEGLYAISKDNTLYANITSFVIEEGDDVTGWKCHLRLFRNGDECGAVFFPKEGESN